MILLKFLCDLIIEEPSRCEVNEKKMRIVRSIADDLVYNISNRPIVTLKHCSVALGLHGMTGQKQPILLLSQLGHCISYDAVREIETAQVEIAQLSQQNFILPVQATAKDNKVQVNFVE